MLCLLDSTPPRRAVVVACLLAAACFSGELGAAQVPLESPALIQPVAAKAVTPAAEIAEAGALDPASEVDSERLWALLRDNHPWATFQPGAWRRTRTVSEALDSEGQVAGRSVTERTERLVEVDETSYVLEVETVVELGGRRTTAEPEEHRLSIATDRPVGSTPPTIAAGDATSIALDGVMVPCRVWRVLQADPGPGELETLYVAPDESPAILRRDRQASVDGSPDTRLVEAVTRIDTPVQYGTFLTAGWRTEAEVTRPGGERSESFAIHSGEPPGGVHHESLVEYDASGRRLRWAVTELVASGRTPEEEVIAGPEAGDADLSIEVRPRRFLRLMRRSERRQDEP